MQSDHLLRAAKDSLPMPRKYNQIHFVLGKIGLHHFHSAGKHDRGPLFFTLFSLRLIRSRSAGSI